MKKHHLAIGVLVLVLVYLAGVKFPGAGRAVLSKIGM